MKTLSIFKEIAKMKAGDGSVTQLWQDKWNDRALCLMYLGTFFL